MPSKSIASAPVIAATNFQPALLTYDARKNRFAYDGHAPFLIQFGSMATPATSYDGLRFWCEQGNRFETARGLAEASSSAQLTEPETQLAPHLAAVLIQYFNPYKARDGEETKVRAGKSKLQYVLHEKDTAMADVVCKAMCGAIVRALLAMSKDEMAKVLKVDLSAAKSSDVREALVSSVVFSPAEVSEKYAPKVNVKVRWQTGGDEAEVDCPTLSVFKPPADGETQATAVEPHTFADVAYPLLASTHRAAFVVVEPSCYIFSKSKAYVQLELSRICYAPDAAAGGGERPSKRVKTMEQAFALPATTTITNDSDAE